MNPVRCLHDVAPLRPRYGVWVQIAAIPHPILTAALLLLALTGSALAEQLEVVSISDGDTSTGLDSRNRQIKVRLHGIDAPEKAQAFGNVSRKALGDLIEGKTVEVQQVDKDRYGRVVASVHVGGVHVNRELVAKGLAWRYVQYDKKGEFTQVEQAAKAPRKGLWTDANPVLPWEWRKSEKEQRAAKKGDGA
jgi:endonuclease YncB( thermonuclease family)